MNVTDCNTVYSELDKPVNKDLFEYDPEIIRDPDPDVPEDKRFSFVRLNARVDRIKRINEIIKLVDTLVDGAMFEVQSRDDRPVLDIF